LELDPLPLVLAIRDVVHGHLRHALLAAQEHASVPGVGRKKVQGALCELTDERTDGRTKRVARVRVDASGVVGGGGGVNTYRTVLVQQRDGTSGSTLGPPDAALADHPHEPLANERTK
jgi:hypothetical protein